MTDIVCVGSVIIDLSSYVPHFPKPGETLRGYKFRMGFGGKGSNQIVCASKLGATTAIVAKVGDDTFGRDAIENMKQMDVNADYMSTTNKDMTGTATIWVNDEGQNSICVVIGANDYVSQSEVMEAEQVIQSAKVLVCQLEVPTHCTILALKLARKYGVTTVLNFAPGLADVPSEIFALSDIFCANETEAEIVTGLSVSSVDDAERTVPFLLAKGCKTVIITLGEKGSIMASKDKPSPIHIPTRKVKAMDTTGAGDAFIGGLCYYLAYLPDLALEEMVRRSSEIATISVVSPGTMASFPYRKDLPEELFTM